MPLAFPAQLEVVIELARFGVVKRREDGRVAFVSPVPCPFNYGSVPNTLAGDGDREDALVLGPRLAVGSRVRCQVLGRVLFEDAGCSDHKWVCGRAPLSRRDRYALQLFFTLYVRAKRWLNRLEGADGVTRYLGLELAG